MQVAIQQHEAVAVAMADAVGVVVLEAVGVGVVVAVGVIGDVGVGVAEAVPVAANLHSPFFPVQHSCFNSKTKYVILSHPSNVDLYRSVSI